MLRSISRTAALLAVPGLLAAACSELPTNVADESGVAVGGLRPGQGFRGNMRAGPDPEFVCYRSEPVKGMRGTYRYRRYAFDFPAEARSKNHLTAILRVRVLDRNNAVVAAANCRIPATPEAVKLMHNRFLLDDRRRNSFVAAGPRFDTVCNAKGVCYLDGLVVTLFLSLLGHRL